MLYLKHLCGCVLTLWKDIPVCSTVISGMEHRLRVFKNRVLRRIFDSERDKVTGGWRKLYKDELDNLCFLPTIIVMIK
jgi:hypothetical protein